MSTLYVNNIEPVSGSALTLISASLIAVDDLTVTSLTSSFQGDLQGTASFATTASHALNSTSPSGISGAIQFSDGSAFASDASNLFWDDTNNRLGIGTNAPSSSLQVSIPNNGTIFSLNNLSNPSQELKISKPFSALNLFDFGTTATNIRLFDSYLRISVGAATTNFSISNNGNIGIGIAESSATSRLHVKGSGTTSATTALLVQNSEGMDIVSVKDDLSVVFNSTITSASSTLRFDVGGVGTIRINSDKVGIGGNTSATARLQVKGSGTTSATTSLLVQNSAGTEFMKITDNGVTTFGGTVQNLGGPIQATQFLNVSSVPFIYETTSVYVITGTTPVVTSGQRDGFLGQFTFAPTSGTAILNVLNVSPTINQTGGANGITRGLYINPTLTAAADFRAIEVTEGNVLIGNTVANTAKLAVKGNGTTGTSTAFRVQNSLGQTAFNIFDSLVVSVQQDLQLNNTNLFWNGGYQIRNKANGLIITGVAGAATGALGLGMSSVTDVNSKAVLELASTTKGFLPPRMTTTQKNAIATPPAGLVVYDTTLNQMSYYNGTSWVNF
jgi:hypothetical protein